MLKGKSNYMTRKIVGLFIGIMLLYPIFAFACPIEGVWRGTLGNNAITMQLILTEYDKQSSGSYFYDQSGEPLYLKYDLDKGSWLEQTMTGQMSGEISDFECKDEKLTAIWRSPNHQQVFQIKAERSDQFESKWQIPMIEDKKTYYFKHHPYKLLKGKNTKSYTVQILGKDSGKTTLNANARNYLRETLDNHLSCFNTVWNQQASGHGHYEAYKKIIDWNRAYIVVYGGYYQYCGQAHGDGSYGGSIFSLVSGQPIKTDKWMDKKILESDEYKVIDKSHPLGKFLTKQYQLTMGKEMWDSCIDQTDFYAIPWATAKGLTFHALARGYAQRVCNTELLVPFKIAMPFLTTEGKSAIQPFLEKS